VSKEMRDGTMLEVKPQSIEIHIKELEGAFLTRTDSDLAVSRSLGAFTPLGALWLKVAGLK
jgi:hypothetical protein